jgi:hypothetical protein
MQLLLSLLLTIVNLKMRGGTHKPPRKCRKLIMLWRASTPWEVESSSKSENWNCHLLQGVKNWKATSPLLCQLSHLSESVPSPFSIQGNCPFHWGLFAKSFLVFTNTCKESTANQNFAPFSLFEHPFPIWCLSQCSCSKMSGRAVSQQSLKLIEMYFCTIRSANKFHKGPDLNKKQYSRKGAPGVPLLGRNYVPAPVSFVQHFPEECNMVWAYHWVQLESRQDTRGARELCSRYFGNVNRFF